MYAYFKIFSLETLPRPTAGENVRLREQVEVYVDYEGSFI